ncbi:MAG: hypothetical protein QNJ20_06710 [Paracoccaceae bacterium]|nr:hypothetical protein [Paracoccaceae bacterium]
MKKFLTTAAVAAIAATPALAKVTIQDLDMTGDSFATYEEVRNAIPGMDMTDFVAIDGNGDRRLSAEEVGAADAQTILTQHQMRGIKERPLVLLDPDGDGFMSYDDITNVHPALSKNTFQEIDANGDGRLSYAEFYTNETQTALAQCAESTFVDLADLDTNGDNFVSMDELKGGYPKVTNADFDTIDLNNDNRISSVELLAPTAECLKR